jgi:hypothetical protein
MPAGVVNRGGEAMKIAAGRLSGARAGGLGAVGLIVVGLLAAGTATASAETPSYVVTRPPAPRPSPFFFGGGVGLGFGDVNWVSVEPLFGYRINPHVAIGTSVLYQWQNDDRYGPSVSTTNYGARAFVQYYPVPVFFLEGEYEYLNYEYVLSDFSTVRSNQSSYLAGAGISQPMGDRSFFFVSALYNFSYKSDDLTYPYSSPWVYSAGVGVGF